jgi:DNA-binding winged helix-turn-helix (wHTH) protein
MRRLRAKLGTEHEQMIGTVRNVGYELVRPSHGDLGMAVAPGETDDANDHEKQQTPDHVTPGTQDDEGLQQIRHEIGIPCRRHGEAQPTRRQ